MLRFRVGPFPVAVFPSFLIGALLLGFYYGEPWKLVAWTFVVFVSVLVHELGHAVVGRALGGSPEIRLEGFGGVTFPNLPRAVSASKQMLLSVAGPVFGLLLGAAIYLLKRGLPPDPGSPSAWVVRQFIFTSVVWAGFNLLPMLPLDGGHILLAAVEGVRRKPSMVAVSWFSALFGVALGLVAWLGFDQTFVAIFCAMFAFQNFSRARLAGRGRKEADEPSKKEIDSQTRGDVQSGIEEARRALGAQEFDAAFAAAARLEEGEGPFRQAAGLRLRAAIELSRGDNKAAALLAGQSFSLWPSPDAAVVAARANLRSGERSRALNWLKRALEAGALPAAVREDPELSVLA